MYIRALTGAYAGQVRDIAYHAAKRLIEAGQATAVDYNPEVRSERVESVSLEGKSVSSGLSVADPILPKRVAIEDRAEPKKKRSR